MTKKTDPTPEAAADDTQAAAEQVTLLVSLPTAGQVVLYEAFKQHDGRQARAAFPALIEEVFEPDNPESQVSLSYLHKGQWHYVSSTNFGGQAGEWHYGLVATLEPSDG